MSMRAWQIIAGVIAAIVVLYFLRSFYHEGFSTVTPLAEESTPPPNFDSPTTGPPETINIDGSSEAPQTFSKQDITLALETPIPEEEGFASIPVPQEYNNDVYMPVEEVVSTKAPSKRRGYHAAA